MNNNFGYKPPNLTSVTPSKINPILIEETERDTPVVVKIALGLGVLAAVVLGGHKLSQLDNQTALQNVALTDSYVKTKDPDRTECLGGKNIKVSSTDTAFNCKDGRVISYQPQSASKIILHKDGVQTLYSIVDSRTDTVWIDSIKNTGTGFLEDYYSFYKPAGLMNIW